MLSSKLAKLKEEGFRITKTRKMVLDVLENASTPLAAKDILRILADKGLVINKTTVYREIDFLKKQRLIDDIAVGDCCVRYELLPKNYHHHHLICTNCSSIECIELDNHLSDLEREISCLKNFKVVSHKLQFLGLCARCLGKK